MRNYYKILGVPETASQDEIKEAYRKLVKQWHPDLNPNDPMLPEMMKLYNAAYETLSDPIARHSHDAVLGLRPAEVHQRPYRKHDNYQNADLPPEIDLNEKNDAHQSWAYEQAAFPISCNIRLGSFCLLIGIVSLIYYVWQVQQIRSAPQWPTTEGSITASQVVNGKHETRWNCDWAALLYYKYTVDGKEYNGSEVVACEGSGLRARSILQSFVSKYSKEPLIIHFDSDSPHRSLIDLQGAIDLPSTFVTKYPLIIAAFGFGIGVYLFLDLLDRKIKHNKALKRVAGKQLRAP